MIAYCPGEASGSSARRGKLLIEADSRRGLRCRSRDATSSPRARISSRTDFTLGREGGSHSIFEKGNRSVPRPTDPEAAPNDRPYHGMGVESVVQDPQAGLKSRSSSTASAILGKWSSRESDTISCSQGIILMPMQVGLASTQDLPRVSSFVDRSDSPFESLDVCRRDGNCRLFGSGTTSRWLRPAG